MIRTLNCKDCRRIVLCDPDYRGEAEEGYYYWSVMLREEVYAVKYGHFFGVKPLQYDLDLEFDNGTRYTGALNITVLIAAVTNNVVIHIKTTYGFEYDYANISITCCSEELTADICIVQATHSDVYDNLSITLNEMLQADDKCVINFPYFGSAARKSTPTQEAVGLIYSEENGYSAVSTSFSMRNARTVFPCFDVPGLKAKFRLCAKFPPQYTFVSSQRGETSRPTLTADGFQHQCFVTTKPISTHMFGFAMLLGYESFGDPAYSLVQIHAPLSKKDHLKWLAETTGVVQKFMRSKRISIPSCRISYVILFNSPRLVDSSYGIVFLDGDEMEQSVHHNANKSTLYTAILNQWIGGVVTVSHWNEVCLQEGLIQYYVWELNEKLDNCSSNSELLPAAVEDICFNYRSPLAGVHMGYVQNTNICDVRAAMVFKGVADGFGHNVIDQLLESLIVNYGYGNPTIDVWDVELASATGQYGAFLGYVKNLFSVPRILDLKVNLNGTFLNVGEHISRHTNPVRLPVLVKLYYSSSPIARIVLFHTDGSRHWVDRNTSWILVDPDGLTCTNIFYDISSYSVLLNARVEDRFGHLTTRRKQRLVDGLCEVFTERPPLLANRFRKQWFDVFQLAAELDIDCKCCSDVQATLNSTERFDTFWADV